MKPISEDRKGKGWKIGIAGEDNVFRGIGKSTKPVNYGIVYLRNMNWPGWTTIHHLNRTSNLYVGYGFKANQTFSPCEPAPVL